MEEASHVIIFLQCCLWLNIFSRKNCISWNSQKDQEILPAEFCGNNKVIGTEFIHQNSKYTIVRYTEKPNKSVTLLSSQHHAEVIDDNGKPEIINFYNSTKAGVDTPDQLVRLYTVLRKTRRWPLTIFFNVLDVASYNAFVLYTSKYPEFYHEFKNRSGRKFICDLVDEIKDSFLESSEESLPPQQKITKYVKSSKCRCVICPHKGYNVSLICGIFVTNVLTNLPNILCMNIFYIKITDLAL